MLYHKKICTCSWFLVVVGCSSSLSDSSSLINTLGSSEIGAQQINDLQSRKLLQSSFFVYENVKMSTAQCNPNNGDDCGVSPSPSPSPSPSDDCQDIAPPNAGYECPQYKEYGMCEIIGALHCALSCQRCQPQSVMYPLQQQDTNLNRPTDTNLNRPQKNSLPYGGGCYTSMNGCKCDDGYRWLGNQNGPHFAGCANPSDDPQGDWCPVRADNLPCGNSGTDYCSSECPTEGAPLTQCMGTGDFLTAWRCLNALRTNPYAFEELFVNLTRMGACQYDSWKDTVAPRPAFTTNEALLQVAYQHAQDMAQVNMLQYNFADGATFEQKSTDSLLNFEGYYDVRPERSELNTFSIIGIISNWMCDDSQREVIMDCGIDTFALGMSQSPYSNYMYITRVLTCQKLSNCACL